ncbi:hypothetical protein O181_093546 [Austropuccinia psidii MF-1]|uniref:Uncharacterized protein n=1 Tax=Austropuccinia psidii MF-1 TaxID=1389203 RepID=A0A9Q3J1P5_9BASI|nr:hypothetical protein [Austropuccinia psidii MF-1]
MSLVSPHQGYNSQGEAWCKGMYSSSSIEAAVEDYINHTQRKPSRPAWETINKPPSPKFEPCIQTRSQRRYSNSMTSSYHPSPPILEDYLDFSSPPNGNKRFKKSKKNYCACFINGAFPSPTKPKALKKKVYNLLPRDSSGRIIKK